jgi:hypothetical protein
LFTETQGSIRPAEGFDEGDEEKANRKMLMANMDWHDEWRCKKEHHNNNSKLNFVGQEVAVIGKKLPNPPMVEQFQHRRG